MSEPRVRVVGVPVLAERAGVPSSVFAFLEARLPQVRALKDGARRGYRLDDAALLAGMAELLYRDGVAFRDAAAMLRTGEREAIVARGRQLLADLADGPPDAAHAADASEAGRQPGSADESAPVRRPIPADALVGGRGERPARTPRQLSPDVAAVLGELIDCVRTLDAARRPSV